MLMEKIEKSSIKGVYEYTRASFSNCINFPPGNPEGSSLHMPCKIYKHP